MTGIRCVDEERLLDNLSLRSGVYIGFHLKDVTWISLTCPVLGGPLLATYVLQSSWDHSVAMATILFIDFLVSH